MSDKKTDISQIQKYLNGELDVRAMHKLEREAQDDPFLMDALEGFEAAGNDQQSNLADLQERLAKRIAPKKERNIILWRVLPIAACLLIALTVGYWYFIPKPARQQYANVVKVEAPDKQPIIEQAAPQQNVSPTTLAPAVSKQPSVAAAPPAISPVASANLIDNKITYKTDTVEYKASDYKVRTNSTVNELLKNMEGFRVDSNGGVNHQGQAVTKARLNGKDYMGGNVAQAVKSLPADIVEKIQVVDDYGNQAARTGVKDGDPNKVLNITTDTTNKKGLIAARTARPVPSLKNAGITNKNLLESRSTGVTRQLEEKSISTTATNTRTITGTVTDSKGEPLIGAAISINGQQQPAISTDINGSFKINVPANNETLAVSYVGYVSQQVKVGDQNNLKIALTEDQNSLSEVVVTGYGTQKRRDVTGTLGRKLEEKATGYATTHISPDTTRGKAPRPLMGKDAYNKYLEESAMVTDGKTGTVKLIFSVSTAGVISNIRIEKGVNDELNQRAINIIKNGTKWIGGTKSTEVKLKIIFHKKN